LEESVASRPTTLARASTQNVRWLSFVQKKVQKMMTNFLYFESQKKTRDEMSEMKERD